MTDDDGTEREFLARLMRKFGIEDLSEAGLFEALGFDELTDEKPEQWFANEVLARGDWRRETKPHVVQVDHEDEPRVIQRQMLPTGREE